MAKLLLVDAPNILIRGVKATERVPLHADGVSTAALLVFINSLARHLREERPDSVMVCWDGGRSEFRTDLYPGYKAHRPMADAEEDERRPFGLTKEFLTLANVPWVEREGWEADDLIAAYWRICQTWDGEVVILSSDHDLLQLVGPRCTQVKVATGDSETDRWDAERVQERYGCAPELLPLSMALQGDPGDGVPGLRGIGPKKAAKLLQAAGGDWDGVLGTLDEFDASTAVLARSLVDLREGPPVEIGPLPIPTQFSPTSPSSALFNPLLHFLQRYELRSVEQKLISGLLWPGVTA